MHLHRLLRLGYGNIAPVTVYGKIATVFYAIIGMPLFLLYLSNIGKSREAVVRGLMLTQRFFHDCRWYFSEIIQMDLRKMLPVPNLSEYRATKDGAREAQGETASEQQRGLGEAFWEIEAAFYLFMRWNFHKHFSCLRSAVVVLFSASFAHTSRSTWNMKSLRRKSSHSTPLECFEGEMICCELLAANLNVLIKRGLRRNWIR